MCLHLDERGSSNWLFTDNNTSSLGQGLIDSTNGIIWSLDIDEEDWLLEHWFGSKLTCVEASSSSWDDLTTTSMDGISMKGNIIDIESDTSHVLITKNTLFGGPLEGSFVRVLDFTQELDTLSGFNEHVWSISIWSIAPDFCSISLVPLKLIDKDLSSLLCLSFGTTISFLDQV